MNTRFLKMAPNRHFRRNVTLVIIERCNMTIKDAAKLVKESRFCRSIRANPEMTMHYTPEEWAERIITQNMPRNVSACDLGSPKRGAETKK